MTESGWPGWVRDGGVRGGVRVARQCRAAGGTRLKVESEDKVQMNGSKETRKEKKRNVEKIGQVVIQGRYRVIAGAWVDSCRDKSLLQYRIVAG